MFILLGFCAPLLHVQTAVDPVVAVAGVAVIVVDPATAIAVAQMMKGFRFMFPPIVSKLSVPLDSGWERPVRHGVSNGISGCVARPNASSMRRQRLTLKTFVVLARLPRGPVALTLILYRPLDLMDTLIRGFFVRRFRDSFPEARPSLMR